MLPESTQPSTLATDLRVLTSRATVINKRTHKTRGMTLVPPNRRNQKMRTVLSESQVGDSLDAPKTISFMDPGPGWPQADLSQLGFATHR